MFSRHAIILVLNRPHQLQYRIYLYQPLKNGAQDAFHKTPGGSQFWPCVHKGQAGGWCINPPMSYVSVYVCLSVCDFLDI